jgi:tricorn protease
MPRPTVRLSAGVALFVCLIACACLLSSAGGAVDQPGLTGARFPALSPDQKTVAFEKWGDIWTAPVDGSSPARRLTDHLAWDYLPRFSPDGASIAFVSDRSGNPDVWVIPAAGGTARQVTTFSGSDVLCGWTPDGRIVFQSNRGLWSTDLYVCSADGQTPPAQLTRADHYNSIDATLLPDGGWLYARGTGNWWRKGYRGTAQYDLWRIFPDGHHERLTDFNGNDEWPMLGADGQTAYYVSSMDGIDNIYSLDLRTRERKQLTHYATDGVQWPSIAFGADTIVYEWNGGLYTIKPVGGTPRELRVALAGESKDNWQGKQDFNNQAGDYAVSPNGKYAVFVYAGDLWGIKDPKAYKDEDKPDQDLARAWRLTQSDGARERMPAFVNDNHTVAYSSDADGDYEIMLLDLTDMSVKKITDNEVDDLVPSFDPANPRVLYYYSGNRKLVRTDLSTNETTTVAEGRFRGAFDYLGYSVSPDGQWVAYVDELPDWSNEIYIVDSLGKDKPVNITRHPDSDSGPQWSADGKRLLYSSDRDGGHGNRHGGNNLYVVDLNPEPKKYDLQFLFADDQPKKEESKQAGEQKSKTAGKQESKKAGEQEGKTEEKAKPEVKKDDAQKDEPKKDEAKKAEPAKVKVEIDFKDIYLRARRVTSQSGVGDGVISADGKWVVYQCNPDLGGAQVWAAKAEGGEARRINGGGWSAPQFADGGKRIYYRDGGTLRYMKFGDGNNQGVEGVDAHGEFTLDKHQRWLQMYREGWRTLGQQFYDPQMHGADWPAVYRKYLPLIENAGAPEEFELAFQEMLGELNASHLGIYMAEHSYGTAGKTTCSLGLEFDPAFAGAGLKVSHVTYRGPADQPGVDIKAGDVLLNVEGQSVGRDIIWQTALDDKQGQPLKLGFTQREGSPLSTQREVVLKPISYGDYQELLYREWELANEQTVSDLSGGRIGYIHIRGMNGGELGKFERELYSDLLDKDALIVDVRFNPGGFIHESLFNDLDRRFYGFSNQRDAPQTKQPARAFAKPKALLINARSGSDAEIFPSGWKTLGLGPVIGVDTSGQVIGTSGFGLVDGTGVRLPLEGWWGLDQRDLELGGTPPDVYIDVTPDGLAAGQDAQLEKAVAVLLEELKKSS